MFPFLLIFHSQAFYGFEGRELPSISMWEARLQDEDSYGGSKPENTVIRSIGCFDEQKTNYL